MRYPDLSPVTRRRQRSPVRQLGPLLAGGVDSGWRRGRGGTGRAVLLHCTYRIQLHRRFRFDDAAAVAGYLARLGVSHLYCSPYLQADEASTHGYDVVDHSQLNDELGGALPPAGRRAFGVARRHLRRRRRRTLPSQCARCRLAAPQLVAGPARPVDDLEGHPLAAQVAATLAEAVGAENTPSRIPG